MRVTGGMLVDDVAGSVGDGGLLHLRGPRLGLRPPTPDDGAPLFTAYAADPEVTRFLGWRPHRDPAQTTAFLATCRRDQAMGRRLCWVLELGDRVIGMADVRLNGEIAGLGYVLARPAWGHGYATEALAAVIPALFAHTPVHALWALCDAENAASARVLEKAGLVRQGLLRRYRVCPNLGPQPRDTYSYAIQAPAGRRVSRRR